MSKNPPPWHVLSVRVVSAWKIEVVFQDGLRGVADLKDLICSEDAGVFAMLRDLSIFAQVYVDHGAVTWLGEVDLAPDALHASIQAQGTALQT
ncbi:DUF2442 domain-containing protein [Pigmentiphaga aceris]|nr:DUF2442 domain-containing protein [Pigmentiphaga aceris]